MELEIELQTWGYVPSRVLVCEQFVQKKVGSPRCRTELDSRRPA